MPLEPNRSLAHYRLIEKIGQGGMGVVWSAEDTRLGRAIGTPRALFRVDLKEHRHANFDTIDGQRFLVNRNVDTGAKSPLTLVLHAFGRAEQRQAP